MLLKLLGSLVLTWILLVGANEPAGLKVYHRISLPGHSEETWTMRGHFDKDSWIPASSFREDLAKLASNSHSRDPKCLYQVALERVEDNSYNSWDLASVKACHLQSITTENFVLHGTSNEIYGLSYSVSPVPPSGGCHDASSQEVLVNLTTTVTTRYPTQPPTPELRTPPPLNPQGQVISPPPEKSFLQKYWVYIAGLFLVISLTGGGDEPQAAARNS